MKEIPRERGVNERNTKGREELMREIPRERRVNERNTKEERS